MKKILLIHGWDYDNYYGRTNDDAWHNRQKFVTELSKNYETYSLDLPGFGNSPVPEVKTWTLDDFAKYIEEYIALHNISVDYILGYSFGGAVAIRWKTNYHHKIKLILVSPAIIRNSSQSHTFLKTPALLSQIRTIFRNFYLIHILKNPEMKYGTKFHQNTYQEIVRLDLTKELENIPVKELIIIFGSTDVMVNPHKLYSALSDDYKDRVKMIEDGGHDIANTHPKVLLKEIKSFNEEGE